MNRLLIPAFAVLTGLLSSAPISAQNDNVLPADGGAPFAAYTARIAAIHAADWVAWKKVTAPDEIAAEIAEAGSDQAAAAAFVETAEFLRLMTPSRAEFIEGHIEGEHATLRVRATRPTTQAQGGAAPVVINEVEMRQHEGRWYLDNERLHSIADPGDAGLDQPPTRNVLELP